MGWLRDSIPREGSIRSLGDVARRALAHPDWPASSQLQARSFAALLSKFDRGLELEWLADRPAVQHVVADVLGVHRSRIVEAAGTSRSEVAGRRPRVRFDDLPFASDLDLTTEPLPPGIPDAVQHPDTWRGLWWHAPSGSGRSLTGAWLSARGLATSLTARDWPGAAAAFPASGPVFVELWSRDGERAILPPRESVCVAAPFLPATAQRSGWTIVEALPVSSWAAPLMRWAHQRLPRDAHLEPESAAVWLISAAARGFVDSFGAALGYAGLIDQYGVPQLEKRGVATTVEHFLRGRVAKAKSDGDPDGGWLAEHGSEVLRSLGARLFTDSREAWDAPRAFEEWVRLIAPEYRQGVETEWVRASIARATSPTAARELDRALRELPPAAFRVIRALECAGLLQKTHQSGLLTFGPRWLSRRVLLQAEASLVHADPAEWGEALLSKAAAGSILRALLERARSGDVSFFDDAPETDAPKDPAVVAAFEMTFRTAGLSVLGGADVPPEVALGLWSTQLALLVEREDGPRPRLEYAAEGEEEPLLETGIFRLAALALSETLPANRGPKHAVLRPWNAETAVDPTALLDSLWTALAKQNPAENPWAKDAWELVDRLPSALATGHPLTWPGRVLSAMKRGELTWSDVRLGARPELVRALFVLAELRGVPRRTLVSAVWTAWAATPSPLRDTLLSPTSPDPATFYAHVPTAALRRLMTGEFAELATLPVAHFDEETWLAVLHTSPETLRGVPVVWQSVPLGMIADVVAHRRLATGDLAILWARAPAVLEAALQTALPHDAVRSAALLGAVPTTATSTVLPLLARLKDDAPARINEEARRAIRAWLHDRVRDRVDGWRNAFELLDDFD